MLVSGLHCAGKEVRKAGGVSRPRYAILRSSLLVPCKNIQTGSER